MSRNYSLKECLPNILTFDDAASFIRTGIPLELGSTVKCGDVALDIHGHEGVSKETDFVIDGYYFENDMQSHVSATALLSSEFTTLNIDVSEISDSKVSVPSNHSSDVKIWMRSYGPLFVGRTVKLKPNSKHFPKHGNKTVTILAFNQCSINEYDDSSLAPLNINWKNGETL
ncbi:hypothetical protein NB620_10595 [Vibrio alginolyticus]|uniref:hypothetical protein n=1 Tax=Vibrio alginolyticus TaxID=663 RepID=UPI00215B9A5E|nr:hypothetical protein [Vibrio alginolyticus]MCS0000713.1 hypothetical protein [Vibrio alginolyticus]